MIKKALWMALALVALLPALALGQDQPVLQEQLKQQDVQEIQDLEEQPPLDRRFVQYGVMFYNLENLFDTINNNGVYDKEFSPEAPVSERYQVLAETAQHGLYHQSDGC